MPPRKAVAEVPFVPPPYNPVKALTKRRNVRKARNSHGFDDFSDEERAAVSHLAGIAFTQKQIARVLGIDEKTLKENFADELIVGRSDKVAEVASNLFRIATAQNHQGTVAAAMYILKQHGGEQWREKQQVKLEADVQVRDNRTIDPARLTDEDRETLRRMMVEAISARPQVIEGEIIENDGSDLV